jgi:hypothetical protein
MDPEWAMPPDAQQKQILILSEGMPHEYRPQRMTQVNPKENK